MNIAFFAVPTLSSREAEQELNRFLDAHRVVSVVRGGSWNNNARNVRAANRNANEPSNRDNNLGFRLARAQTQAGEPAPDPAATQSVRAFSAGSKHSWSRRRVGRTVDSVAKTRRRLFFLDTPS